MELKEGMYVRTNDGFIDKVIIDYKGCCNNPNCNCKHVSCEKNYYDEEKIIKTSYNLIDLIEEGDYVNGYKVLEICTGNFELNNPLNVKALKLEFIKEDINPNIPFFKRYNFITNSEIKSIITKEQFDSMKYVLGDKE